MTLIVDVIEAPSGAPVELTKQSAPKAWINFNGTGTIALRDSFNTSSVVDNGTGDYTFNFTNNFSDANYGNTSSIGQGSGGVSSFFVISPDGADPTASAFRCNTFNDNVVSIDAVWVGHIFMGDLA